MENRQMEKERQVMSKAKPKVNDNLSNNIHQQESMKKNIDGQTKIVFLVKKFVCVRVPGFPQCCWVQWRAQDLFLATLVARPGICRQIHRQIDRYIDRQMDIDRQIDKKIDR